MKLILKPSEITAEMPIGGKARALWRLGSTGLNIPGWIVVLPQAYEIWQSSTQQGLLEEDLRRAVLSALPDAKVFAVLMAIGSLVFVVPMLWAMSWL